MPDMDGYKAASAYVDIKANGREAVRGAVREIQASDREFQAAGVRSGRAFSRGLAEGARNRRIQINADLNAAAVERQLDRLSRNRRLSLAANLDTAGTRAALDRLAKERKVQLRVELVGQAQVAAQLDRLARTRSSTITARSNTTAAAADMDRTARSRRAPITGEANSGRAEGALNYAARHRTVRMDADVGPALAKVAALSAAMAALGGAGGGIVGLAGGGVGALGALGGSLLNVVPALSAYKSAQDKAAESSGGSAGATRSAATAVRGATEQYADAQERVGRVAEANRDRLIDASADIVSAQRRQAQVARDTARDVAAGERDIATAIEAERRAQEGIAPARRQAIRDLEDLSERSADYALDAEGQAIAIARAQERVNAVNEDSTASALDRREATYQLNQAIEAQSDAARQQTRDSEDLAIAQAKGVDGADSVVSAQRAVADAAARTVDAQAELVATEQRGADARLDAAEAVASAELRKSRAVRQGADDMADAQKAVSRAAQAIRDAQAAAADSGGGGAAKALDKFAEKMAKLSPAGREFVNQLISMKAAKDRFAGAMETATLPGFTELLQGIAGMEGPLTEGFAEYGAVLSDTASRAAGLAREPLFQGQVTAAMHNAVPIIREASDGLLDLTTDAVRFGATSGEVFTGTGNLIRSTLAGVSDYLVGVHDNAAGVGDSMTVVGNTTRDALGFLGEFSGNMATNASPALSDFRSLLQQGEDLMISLSTNGAPLLNGAIGGITGTFQGALGVIQNVTGWLGNFGGVLGTAAGSVFGVNRVLGMFGTNLGNSGFGVQAFTTKTDAAGRKTNDFRDALRNADGVSGKARAGYKSIVDGGLNPLGIALTAGTTLLAMYGQRQQDLAATNAAQTDRTRDLAQALRESNGVIDSNVRSTSLQSLENHKVSDGYRNLISDAAKYAGPGGIGLLKDAALGNADAMGKLRFQLTQVKDQNTDTGNAFALLTTKFSDMNTVVKNGESSLGALNETGRGARDLLNELDKLAPTMSDAVASNNAFGQASGSTAGETGKLNEALKDMADNSKDAASSGERIIGVLDKLSGRNRSAEELQQRWNDSMRQANQQFSEMAKGADGGSSSVERLSDSLINAAGQIDTTSEAGSKFRTFIADAAENMAAFAQSQINANVPMDQVQRSLAGQESELRKNLKTWGLSENAIDRVLQQYNAVPDRITSVISTSGEAKVSDTVGSIVAQLQKAGAGAEVPIRVLDSDARQQLLSLGYHLAQLPDGTVKVFANTTEGQTQFDQFIASNQGKPITAVVGANTSYADGALDFWVQKADGTWGWVHANATKAEADGVVDIWKQRADGTWGYTKVNANDPEARRVVSAWKQWTEQQKPTVPVQANTGPATDTINRWFGDFQERISMNPLKVPLVTGSLPVGATGGLLGGQMGPTGFMPGYASGGRVAGFAPGGAMVDASKVKGAVRAGVPGKARPGSYVAVIGDRSTGDEWAVPGDGKPRTLRVLEQAARANRRTTVPMGSGAASPSASPVAAVATPAPVSTTYAPATDTGPDWGALVRGIGQAQYEATRAALSGLVIRMDGLEEALLVAERERGRR